MIDSKHIDNLTNGLLNILPTGIKNVQSDIEKNVRAALQSAFSKLDLVTREEFDVQSAVLLRTRMKLEALEKQVQSLEALMQNNVESPSPSSSD